MTRTMMMAQPYYGGELGSYHREPHRSMSAATYYDRTAPYTYHELPDYGRRSHARTLIHESDPEQVTAGGQPRRRITVAVWTGSCLCWSNSQS